MGPSQLAGMVVATDPYAFEDEPEDSSFFPINSTNSSDISLKNGTGVYDSPMQNVGGENWNPANGQQIPNNMFIKNDVCYSHNTV